MELGGIQTIISKAFEQAKADQIIPLLNWLDGEISKYRLSGFLTTPIQSVLTPKINHGQRFVCTCGRSFSAEISIRETTNVETSSPPATPMLSMKTDLKQMQHSNESNGKRARMSMIEPSTSLIPTTTNTLIERLNPSTMINHWSTPNLKNYGNSPELITNGSNRGESDIELSSDESRCLEDIDAVLSPDKSAVSNFIYSNSLWPTYLSPSNNSSLPYGIQHHHHHHHHQENSRSQMITLKPVINEPLSPSTILAQDEQLSKTVATIHRRPMLVAFTDSEACSPTGPTQFKCTQCHEIFDSLLLGQDHANNGMCISHGTANMLDTSDSHPSPTGPLLFDSLQENVEEVINIRSGSKAACPICNKVFSSVHTMIRHKTSIHDRQVRYECNICGRFFFRKDKLTSHMVYHQDFDTYVCCFCSVGCKSRMLMRQHLKRDHVISSEDNCFNDVLNRCQVKKSLNLDTNMSVAYGAEKAITSLKRNLSSISAESDMKQTTSN